MSATPDVRLGELLAGLSLATDIGNDQPLEKGLRMCLIATRVGRDLGLAGAELSDVFYTGMLRFLGCTSFAPEMGAVYGEDNVVRKLYEGVDAGHPAEAIKIMLTKVGTWEKGLGRARIVAKDAAFGARMLPKMIAADCEVATRLAKRLHLGDGVAAALGQMFERFDGKGRPGKLKGDEASPAARIAILAHRAEAWFASGGAEESKAKLLRGRGAWFDPDVVDAFLARAADHFAAISDSVWDAVLDEEPEPRPHIRASAVDDVALAFADFADLKSPYTLGHSAGVAALAERAGRACRLDDRGAGDLRRAALLHDLGRVSVASGVWDKKGPLSAPEWERVRLHAYQTERVLSRTPLLAPLGRIAGLHHERLDGSGYHRGAPGADLGTAARVLAAADVFHAMTESRPHRPAVEPDVAAKEVQAMAAAGKLDPEAAAAVCEAAGQQSTRKGMWPAGLTDREVEVLRLLAQGLKKKDIAAALFISPSTAHTHVVHVYEKIGVSSRAAAALFAMENALIRERPGNQPNDR